MCEETKVYPSVGFLLPLPATGMWTYALEHGHITDPHRFLMDVTERQDLVMNMTTMSDQQFSDEVHRGLKHLNDVLNCELDEQTLIKTGGYQKHDHNQSAEVFRHRNVTNTMNYANMAGSV
jgi:hypothetical protein